MGSSNHPLFHIHTFDQDMASKFLSIVFIAFLAASSRQAMALDFSMPHSLPYRVRIAVSTSLAPEYVRSLTSQAPRIGAEVILRGLPVSEDFENAAHFGASRETQQANRLAVHQALMNIGRFVGEGGQLLISPDPFEAYGVKGVPVFVIEGRQDSSGAAPVYIVRGQVTLRRALRHVLSRTGRDERELSAFLTEALERLPAGAEP